MLNCNFEKITEDRFCVFPFRNSNCEVVSHQNGYIHAIFSSHSCQNAMEGLQSILLTQGKNDTKHHNVCIFCTSERLFDSTISYSNTLRHLGEIESDLSDLVFSCLIPPEIRCNSGVEILARPHFEKIYLEVCDHAGIVRGH